MGRPPSNGGPTFRFNQAEVTEMEAILQAHNTAMPERDVLLRLAEKFSSTPERSGKIKVQMKQVWNWFQNRRYAIRAKAARTPGKLLVSSMPRDNSAILRNGPQVPPQPLSNSSAPAGTMPFAPQHPPASSVKSASENSPMEFEAKSARDGAWYDVSTFLSHRALETGDPEVLVRFSGFGPEEDEWVNIRKHVRQRSLPCESSECVAVLPGDLILCFQEGKEQALYFDAHVLDAQRRRHDVRGCRCRFLVRYDHDQSEEIVALRKICRRPETDYRLQQLHALNESASANQNKTGANIHMGSTLRVYPPAEVTTQKPLLKVETAVTVPQPSLPVSTETKLQHKVEPVVLPPKINPPQVSEGATQQKVEPTASAPPHSTLPEVSEANPQQKAVVGPTPHGNLPEVSEAKPREKVIVGPTSHGSLPEVSEGEVLQKGVVGPATHGNLPEVTEAEGQQKIEVAPAPSHSNNLPEVSEAKAQPVVVSVPSHSDQPEIVEGTAQQNVEHVGPRPMTAGVSEATSEGKVDEKVETLLPEPSSTNVGETIDIEGQSKDEPVIIPAPVNVPEVAEVTVQPQDVEMVNADKESNSVVTEDNATETSVSVPTATATATATTVSDHDQDQDQEMQDAS